MSLEPFFPKIIADKIYWYIWKHSQRLLCIDYREHVRDGSDLRIPLGSGSCNYYWMWSKDFNQRRMFNHRNLSHKNIPSIRNSITFTFSPLPKYYCYSNGSSVKTQPVSFPFSDF